MPMDFNHIVPQIISMGEHIKSKGSSREAALKLALENISSRTVDQMKLQKRIEDAKTTWLVAGLTEPLYIRKNAPDCPADHTVIGVDGSHIDVDRHQSVHCFLINIGGIAIQYGKNPDADLFAETTLYYKDEETSLVATDNRKVPIEREILGIKRNIAELSTLTQKMIDHKSGIPVVGLLDGTLTLWGIIGQDFQDAVIDEFIRRGLLKHLDNLKKSFKNEPSAIGSYISFPRSTEAVNVLRVLVCPYENVNCDKHCGHGEKRPCEVINGLNDRDIFNEYLEPGQRSAIFSSRSSVVEKYYGEHRVNFFYIRLENEVARVEIPQWVAEEDSNVDLIHSVILKQCDLGVGYPVALMESHEKAVINGAEREQFWTLVSRLLESDNMQTVTSAKNWSKKRKWI